MVLAVPSDTLERQSTPHLVHPGKVNDHVDFLFASSSYFPLQPQQVSSAILYVTFHSHGEKKQKRL